MQFDTGSESFSGGPPLSVSLCSLSSPQPAPGQCEVTAEAGSKIPVPGPGAGRVPGEATFRVLRGRVPAQEAGRGCVRARTHPAVPAEGTGRARLHSLPRTAVFLGRSYWDSWFGEVQEPKELQNFKNGS